MNMLEGQMLDKDMDDDLDVEDRGFHTKVRRKEWKVIDDGKTVKYSGANHSSVMGEKPLNDDGVNTFSVQVDEAHSLITIGVATRLHRLDS